VANKKAPRGCVARGLKAKSTLDSASHSAVAFQSQIHFIARRIGTFDPAMLATLAFLAFGEVRS
jgi:hypothetical protein